MRIRFKIIVPIVLAVILVLAGVGFLYRQGFQVKKGNNTGEVGQPVETGKGTVEGTVRFVGVPCNPNQGYFKVPPCDGPYPNYEINFYKVDKKTVVGRAVSNDKGFYLTELAAGSYFILGNSGKLGNQGDILVIVRSGETTFQDIRVDTGVR